MRTVAIIPARMASTRFPGKPMEKIHGIPMIGHVYFRTIMAKNIDFVCVATCDQIIFNYIESLGGIAIMTSDTHDRASDRAAEALIKIEQQVGMQFDYVAMIQGDEPLVQPDKLDKALSELFADPTLNVVNLMGVIDNKKIFQDVNEVKVVVNLNGCALYFSREPIPSISGDVDNFPMKKQLGLIFFRRNYLIRFNEMAQTPLEIIESIDMLRVLENGDSIKMIEVDGKTIGVDTYEEMKTAEKLLSEDPIFNIYREKAEVSNYNLD